MKIRVDIDRGHYKASMEFSDEEEDNLKEAIQKILLELDNAIKSTSGIWNSSMSTSSELTILPTGSVRFENLSLSQINQLVLLTGMGGTRGITAQEASNLLAIPYKKITSLFTEEKYKKLFRKIEEGRYALSKEGALLQMSVQSTKETPVEDGLENES